MRYQWCNGYRRRNWTRRHEFKSWTDCISHSTNTLGKGMNPIILPPAMGKIVGQTRFFSLGEATSLGEGKLWIQTCLTPLKKLTLCYILPERRGWVNMILWIELPWPENPVNICAWHSETLDSCIQWSPPPPQEIETATTKCRAENLPLNHQSTSHTSDAKSTSHGNCAAK